MGKFSFLAPQDLVIFTNEIKHSVYVSMANTELRSLVYEDSTVCKGLKQLVIFNLSFNQISLIPAFAFDMAYLHNLDLSQNHLRTIKNNAFASSFSIAVLRLDRNHLTLISSNVLIYLRKLKLLKLSGRFRVVHLVVKNI